MSSGFWDQPENNEYSVDRPDLEDPSDFVPPTTPRQHHTPQQLQVNEIVRDIAQEQPENDDQEEDFSVILSDANLRIEQGTLYKMIMNHDLFEGMDVDPRAIKNVQREIRQFARERMDVMLGMRQPKSVESVVSSPFNELEVTVLKRLASAASKGATESSSQPTTQAAAPKKTSITPIKSQPKQQSKPLSKPLATTTDKPIQRSPKQVAESKPLDKPIEEMSEEDLLQRNKEIAARQAMLKAKPQAGALPQPTYEQQELLFTQRVLDSPINPSAVSAIVSALGKTRKQ